MNSKVSSSVCKTLGFKSSKKYFGRQSIVKITKMKF